MTLRERAQTMGPALIRSMVTELGGQAAAARAVGLSQPAVCYWLQARPRPEGWLGYPRVWAQGPEWTLDTVEQLLVHQGTPGWPVERLDRLVVTSRREKGWVQLLMAPGRPTVQLPSGALQALLESWVTDLEA